MIYSGRLKKTLLFLDVEYTKQLTNSDVQRPVIYSKMALLEYCGWLELSFDEVARNCVRKKFRTVSSRKLLEDKITDTHGFTYKNCVRPLLIYGLGFIELKNVEKKLEKDGSLQKLSSNLGSLTKMRGEAAHTFTSDSTASFPAPSLTFENFRETEPIVQKLWHLVRQ